MTELAILHGFALLYAALFAGMAIVDAVMTRTGRG